MACAVIVLGRVDVLVMRSDFDDSVRLSEFEIVGDGDSVRLARVRAGDRLVVKDFANEAVPDLDRTVDGENVNRTEADVFVTVRVNVNSFVSECVVDEVRDSDTVIVHVRVELIVFVSDLWPVAVRVQCIVAEVRVTVTVLL